ncbi:MAG: hypothetical protein COZ18_07200 [Flexibacter sp. CG_4_10_14_3_um_filter_32_15]|nr:MAG: hypothetical protein COZ18_07200 [Flexibacter sp. CG_4_10_14_3_um_filter_32_15]
MLKFIISLALSIVISSAVLAQKDTLNTTNKPFLNINSIGAFASVEWGAEYFVFLGDEGKMYPGYNFGINTSKTLSKRWTMITGIGYSKKKYQTGLRYYNTIRVVNGTIENGIEGQLYETHTIQDVIIPINFYLDYGQHNKSRIFYFLSFGTELGVLINHKRHVDYQNELVQNQSSVAHSKFISKVNLNFGAGLGYQFKNNSVIG